MSTNKTGEEKRRKRKGVRPAATAAAEEEVYGFTCITFLHLFFYCCLIWLWVAGYMPHISDKAHTSFWLGVLRCCGWHPGTPAKMECEMNRFSFMLCQVVFQGKMEIPLCHMSNLAPYKLWNSFVKLGSNLNELQSGFGCISLRRICLWGRYGKMWQCVSSVLKVHLQPTCNLETQTYRSILLLSHLSAISAVFEDLLIFMLWGF